jgi:hypothetical protein
MPSLTFYNELIGSGTFGSGSESGTFGSGTFGSGTFESRSGSGGENKSCDDQLIILIVLAPFLLIFLGCCSLFLLSIIEIIINNIKDKIHIFKTKYCNKNSQIINGKLNKKIIKTLNINNHENVDKTTSLDCSICIEQINLETFKLKSNKLIFLNCNHVFHTECMQQWVKSQVKQINKPTCPLCRDIIINIEQPKCINYSSDDSDASEASYWND